MSTTNLKMKLTMETMFSNAGYSVQVQIISSGYKATCAVSNSGTMTLQYPDTLTPGEIVWNVLNILNKQNRKEEE